MVEVEDVEETQLYADLRGFLLHADPTRTDVRRAATEAVLQVRDAPGRTQMVRHGIVPALARNVSHDDPHVAISALRGLVQLSAHGPSANQAVEDLTQAGGLNRMLEIVLSRPEDGSGEKNTGVDWKQRVNLAMALLANMTRVEKGAVELVGRSLPDRAIVKPLVDADNTAESGILPTKPSLELILARFLNTSFIESTDYDALEGEVLDSDPSDPYQHFAAVLMNATQVEAGRQFALRIHRNPNRKDDLGWTVLERILVQLKSPNPLRRRGVAGTIRNCCLERDAAWWMLHVLKITKHILYPLAGPEELDLDEKKGLDPDLWLEGPDKKREPDHYTRLFLVEAILLLCSTGRKNREQLRLNRVYVVLKWADMVEEQEDVSECINECVQYLRRDEEGTEEGSSDKLVHDAYNKPSIAQQVGTSADFDDVD